MGEECVAAGGGEVVGGERGARFLIRTTENSNFSVDGCAGYSSRTIIKTHITPDFPYLLYLLSVGPFCITFTFYTHNALFTVFLSSIQTLWSICFFTQLHEQHGMMCHLQGTDRVIIYEENVRENIGSLGLKLSDASLATTCMLIIGIVFRILRDTIRYKTEIINLL
ncbi:hypothetical protein VNO80_17824 [Phaseolus coccineus]|uniref:Uncharacterized protein n=1 Tax=Phaseolus coccineus TaxID=3886 RepID=A0AAN9MJ71_PHACN